MTLFKKTGEAVGEVKELKTLAEKSKGLIGAESPFGAHFKTRLGIHTLGLRFPIDVVVADDDLKIRAIRKNLPPRRMYFWNPRFQNVFELPAGSADGLQIGNELELRS